ncbi:MAG: carbon-nitrogen hydrolase family protein [Clostridia bacterium]|nr:carbon-nitrogen hydrolase family protein [Clostridia bacterium]
METLFITDCSIEDALKLHGDDISNANLVVFGFNGMGLVSYKKELSGETDYFRDLAILSKQIKGVVISGCDTDSYGSFRHSAAIADCGKLLGVSDMVHLEEGSEFVPGAAFRVYDTSIGKIGIIIEDDLYFPEVVRVLSLCDADFIVCILKKIEDFMPQIMLRASAYSNGVSMSLCAKNYACVANANGKISALTKTGLLKTEVAKDKDYHLVSLRKRGMYKEFNSGY